MAASFLGATVLVSLHTGTQIQGRVTQIDPGQGTLTIEGATDLSSTKAVASRLKVQRSTIRDLQLISVGAPPNGHHHAAPPHPTPSSIVDPAILSMGRPSPSLSDPPAPDRSVVSTSADRSVVPPAKEHVQEAPLPPETAPYSPSLLTPMSARSGSMARRRKKAAALLQPRGSEADESAAPTFEDSLDESEAEAVNSTSHEATADELPPRSSRLKAMKPKRSARKAQTVLPSAAPPASNGLSEDFDFESGLARFDKQKVFAEISARDRSDPSLLLVAHNRRLKIDPYTTKLLHTENVLDSDSAAEGPSDTQTPPILPRVAAPFASPRAARRSSSKGLLHTSIQGPTGRVQCITSKQYREIEVLANVETGPNLQQRVENGGRAIAELVLDPHAGFITDDDNTQNRRPLIVLLVGPLGFKSACGLRGAAHLANHGAEVVTCVPTTDALPPSFEFYLRLFSSTGGRIVRSVDDLPLTPDVIIDALMDADARHQSPYTGWKTGEMDVVSYANDVAAPTLSINWPSASDPDTGTSIDGLVAITPAATVCLGAVRSGALAGPGATGALWLADIGWPSLAFERVIGAEDWHHPFGRRWIVPLRFE